ncbi:inner nuclear membrane protein enriched at telomere/subtelomere region [Coemansia thaxteri]|uniref:Inner nuclear membrane protein enriched at telomere/subtelomere region n=1 Tax=Coemansia thaxteri TaxID=2663907 RepID=A0A9W8EHP7_9FUNG|nr:inner nuclear membrane protein enriched at telomere/subtelomere region [Coemansia thaxteri]KAJ2487595.1 inner nuclear membrane protein enriched at telomere/subtelomere region [Coemansia sp. RSA 2320]
MSSPAPDSHHYLDPGFDPQGLKMSAIRNILTKHGVEYPSNAKKSDLLAVLQRGVLDRASGLRKEARRQKRVKADGRSIEVVASATASTIGARTRARTPSAVVRTKKREKAAAGEPKLSEGKPKPSEGKPGVSEGKPKASSEVPKVPGGGDQRDKLIRPDTALSGKIKKKTRKLRAPDEQRAKAKGKETETAKGKGKEKENPVEAPAAPSGVKRKLSDAGSSSDDERFFTPRQQRTLARAPAASSSSDDDAAATPPRAARKHVTAHARTPANFSDENPFQSSPETARKRRRKASAAAEPPAAPVTPMAALLRKSHASDLSFKVQLPSHRAAELPEPEHEPEHLPEPSPEQLPPPPPRFNPQQPESLSPRFTMTPDALRQLAAAASREPRRATVAPISGLARSHALPAAAAAPASDSDSDGSLQRRRRMATLRRRMAGPHAAQSAHSRQTSAHSAGPSTPPPPPASPRIAMPSRSRRKSNRLVVLGSLLSAAVAAALAWHTHAQFDLGFGNVRADQPFLALPADRAPAALGPPPDNSAPLPARLAYAARLALAKPLAALAPTPLPCPEHAECVPYTPLHAWQAPAPGPRDQWVVAGPAGRVAAVHCDAGHVVAFPPLAPRVVPRVPACVRDASAEVRVRRLADALVAECAAHRGRVQCEGSLMDHARMRLLREPADANDEGGEEADEIEKLGVSVAELRRVAYSRLAPALDGSDVDTLFDAAVAELASGARRGEVAHYVLESYDDEDDAAGDSGTVTETVYFVARRADAPMLCRLRRVALDAVLGNVRVLLGAAAASMLALLGSRRVTARRAERRAADALVTLALRRLKRQARRHYVDPALSPSPAIPSLQLRDLLLLAGGADTPDGLTEAGHGPPAAYYDPRARAAVWDRVRAVVERSANVRCRTTAVRGEPMRVWEWIGPLEDDSDDGGTIASSGAFSPFASPMGSPMGSPMVSPSRFPLE